VQSIDSGFPKIYVELESKLLRHLDSVHPESSISGVLKSCRVQDRDSAKTTFGPNRTDFLGYYMPDRIPAVYCSTGQQKSLLISILMAHQISLVKRDILSPILLLDEVFVHLDDNKRASLAEFLIHNKSQCFITSTELQLEKLLKYPKIVSF
jgi:DNA replication and repair protein RecF